MEEIKNVPCIKCGREIGPNAVFCQECLEDMEKHPVKPGTPVVLHTKPTTSIRCAPTRKVRKPEEQVRSLKKSLILTWILAALLATALGVVTYLWLTQRNKPTEAPRPGENYQTSQTNTPIN